MLRRPCGRYPGDMAQVTWRASDALVDRVRRAAASRGASVNEYVTQVLDAATDPDLAGSETAAVRERLERAGLLVHPSASARRAPTTGQLAEARARAGRGTPLSEIIADSR